MCRELSHLRSIDTACELLMDHDPTLTGTVVYLQKDNLGIVGRVVMPKYRNTCSLCNRVNSDLVQYRILFCNAIDDCRKELWETIIELHW